MSTTVPTALPTDPAAQIAAMQAQIDTLQMQLTAWAEAATRDQAERTTHTRKLVWALLDAHKLAERATMMADARHAQRQAEERTTEAVRDRDRAEAELHDLKLLLGRLACGPIARRMAVAREVWGLAWNTRDVLSIGGRTGFDAAMAQLDIMLENRDWDGRPASYPTSGDDPIPAAELARPSAILDGTLLGRMVHIARRRAAKAALWSAAADTPWDDLPRGDQALCEWIGQLLAIAGAGGALRRAYAVTGALDDAAWLLRENPGGDGAVLALARIDTCLTGDDPDRAAGTTRRALQAVAAAATELRGAIAGHEDDEVTWMRAPGPRIETLDAALDHYDLATANGADLVAPDTFERAIDLASWALADGEHHQGAVMLTLLFGAPVGDALAHSFAAALRDARRAHAEHPSGGGRADAAQSL
jgi:hypothetical protein